MTKHFRKELCNNKFFFNNVAVAFECQPTNTGVIALDTEKDADLIAFLDDAITKRKGGIGLIDAATYEAIKKNKTERVSVAFSTKKRLQVLQVPGPFKSPEKSAEAAAGEGVYRAAQRRAAESRLLSRGAQRGAGDQVPAGTGQAFTPERGRVLNETTSGNP